MKMLQNRIFLAFLRFVDKRGCEHHLVLWKGCQPQQRLGTYALEGHYKKWHTDNSLRDNDGQPRAAEL